MGLGAIHLANPGGGFVAEGREVRDSAATEVLVREQTDFDFRLLSQLQWVGV
jgi:hypothetical protein